MEKKGKTWANDQAWRVIEDQKINNQSWRRFEDQDTRLCLDRVLFFSLVFEFIHCITNDHCMAKNMFQNSFICQNIFKGFKIGFWLCPKLNMVYKT